MEPVVNWPDHEWPGVPFGAVGMAGGEGFIGDIHFFIQLDEFLDDVERFDLGIAVISRTDQCFAEFRGHERIPVARFA